MYTNAFLYSFSVQISVSWYLVDLERTIGTLIVQHVSEEDTIENDCFCRRIWLLFLTYQNRMIKAVYVHCLSKYNVYALIVQYAKITLQSLAYLLSSSYKSIYFFPQIGRAHV